jgi:TRAP-type mannitol/chloroaromatic compound transport system permease small subunit
MNNASASSVPMSCRIFSGLGFICGRLLLILVVLQFSIVLARYLFAVNFLWLQELAVYLHASIFMLAAAWSLVGNRHVRIDALSERLSRRLNSRIERAGTVLLLFPMMVVIFLASLPYVFESWAIAERSAEVSGLPGLFLLKSLVPVFAVLMIWAGLMRLIDPAGR